MHEASIAMSILDTVIGQCRQEGYGVIESVRVQIGAAAGILPDALAFAFDIAKEETIAADAVLIIDLVPLGGICHGCGREFEVNDNSRFVFECPICASSSIKIDRGHEMRIVDMEVD